MSGCTSHNRNTTLLWPSLHVLLHLLKLNTHTTAACLDFTRETRQNATHMHAWAAPLIQQQYHACVSEMGEAAKNCQPGAVRHLEEAVAVPGLCDELCGAQHRVLADHLYQRGVRQGGPCWHPTAIRDDACMSHKQQILRTCTCNNRQTAYWRKGILVGGFLMGTLQPD